MTDPLPRLAVALREVGDRIHQISAELTTLQTAPLPGSRPAGQRPAAQSAGWRNVAPGAQAPDQTGDPAAPRSGWTESMAAPRPSTGEPTGPRTASPEAAGVPAGPQPGWWPAPNPTGPIPSWPALPPPKPRLWEREGAGSRLLAWVGGIVTLAGVVLLLVLAIQRGYLGPLPRVLLGAGLGLALIGIGMRLRPSPAARTGAYALAATGFGVLYLDVIAATTLFEFFLPAVGLGVGLAVAAFGLGLAARWDTQGFATFVVVSCAVCAPFLAEGALLLGFLLVLEICATPVQLAKRWGRLCVAAGIPPVLAVVATIPLAGADGPIVAYLALVTSAVQILVATISVLRRPDDVLPVGLMLLAPAPAMFAAILLPQAGAVALPATIGALGILVWALGRLTAVTLPTRFELAAGAAGAAALLQATVTALDGSALAIVLLAQALLLAVLALRTDYPAAVVPAGVFGLVGLAGALAAALPVELVTGPPRNRLPVTTVITAGLTGVLLAITMVAVCLAMHRANDDAAGPAWVIGGVSALYGATGAVLAVGLLISPDRTGFLLGHVLVTVSWTVGALVLLLRGINSMPQRIAGLSLVGAALVKLVLFDLSSLDGFARVAAFLVAGLVLLGAGARYAKLVAAGPYSPGT